MNIVVRKEKINAFQSLYALSKMSDKPNPYHEYERRKKEIQAQNLSPHDYEKAIQRLSDELRI